MTCNCNTSHAFTICYSCNREGCLDCINPENGLCWRCEDEDEAVIIDIYYQGKLYFHDETTGDIFDPETGEEVGKMVYGEVELY